MVNYKRRKSITIPHTLTIEDFDLAVSEFEKIFEGSNFSVSPIRYPIQNGIMKANNQGYKIHIVYDPDHWKKYGKSFLEQTPEVCLEFYERIVKYKGTEADKKVEMRSITPHSFGSPSSMPSNGFHTDQYWAEKGRWSRNANGEDVRYSYFSLTLFSRDFKQVRDTMKALIGRR